ncbi:MAG: sigma-54-dependent Fis family transcriptional regulator [Bryobacterales bacterium]|nr:sigma-54-dependent Fis family transcriptional regulator [Bryobacterales bacterium]
MQTTPSFVVLAVDDDPQILLLLQAVLSSGDIKVVPVSDPGKAMESLKQHKPMLVLLDYFMPGMNGMEVLDQIVEFDPGIDVIFLTSHYSPQAAVEAIRRGAADYLTKPIDINMLLGKVGQLVSVWRHRHLTSSLDRQLLEAFQFEGLVGRSPAMLEVFARIRRIAPHFRNILVTGATGTGKELVAKALHRLSPVAQRRFATCNCGAIVESLIESELFGYVRGAFTGATQDKVGLFEYADGGVLFLDEIGEMPLATQTKLLRVLQQQEIQRVGSPATRKVDVRVIAATHRDLIEMVKEKRFREDLFYRLSMIDIKIPPLADRKEDLPLLMRHFLERFAQQYGKPLRGLTRRAQIAMLKYPWPGNVREIENCLGHACMMADGEFVDLKDLPERIMTPNAAPADDEGELVSLEEAQRRYVDKVLKTVGGNKVRAAEILKVSRATLYRMIAATNGNGSESSGDTVGIEEKRLESPAVNSDGCLKSRSF